MSQVSLWCYEILTTTGAGEHQSDRTYLTPLMSIDISRLMREVDLVETPLQKAYSEGEEKQVRMCMYHEYKLHETGTSWLCRKAQAA